MHTKGHCNSLCPTPRPISLRFRTQEHRPLQRLSDNNRRIELKYSETLRNWLRDKPKITNRRSSLPTTQQSQKAIKPSNSRCHHPSTSVSSPGLKYLFIHMRRLTPVLSTPLPVIPRFFLRMTSPPKRVEPQQIPQQLSGVAQCGPFFSP